MQPLMTPIQLLNHRWAMLGFGREGQALARWVRRQSPRRAITVFCEQPPPPQALAELDPDTDRLYVGPLDTARLAQYPVLVKSPGISPLHTALRALPASLCVTSTTNLWFAQRPDERVIGITGTKGKSTTAALTAHLLRSAGLRVELVGNIGVPVMERLDARADWWVMELSSYQTADLHGRLELGVLLSLFPEHLDWHGDEAAYVRDKVRLLRCAHQSWAPWTLRATLQAQLGENPPGLRWLQHERGILVGDTALLEASPPEPARPLLALEQLPLRGRHNAYNISVAWELARYAGVDDATVRTALAGFRALPHRLENLGRCGAHQAVNDSISTTPHAAMAALQALSSRSVATPSAVTPCAITILVGGHDRGVSWQDFADYLRRHPPHAVVAMGVQGQAIAALLRRQAVTLAGGVHSVPDLPAAVALARHCTPPGGTILLSPGAPSYGEFTNFEARGEAFKQALQATAQ